MDDGESDTSNDHRLQNDHTSTNFHTSMAVDSLIEDLLRTSRTTCSHTHSRNPPGLEDSTHTHTCFHTHTQFLASEGDQNTANKDHSDAKLGRPLGNREAVRKYREKKKARAAYLEEEVKRLHLENQQLVRKLQRQAILKAEVLKLRGLLIEIRGKIDNEVGAFPLQKQCNVNSTIAIKEGNFNIGEMCRIEASASGETGLSCHPLEVDCRVNASDISSPMDAVETLTE